MKGVAVLGRREPEIEAERAVDAARRQSAALAATLSAGRTEQRTAARLEAFTALYDDHAAAVHASARLIWGLDRADDVTRNVFVSAWSRPGWLDSSDDTVRTQMIIAVYRHAGGRSRHALGARRGTGRRRKISPFRHSHRTASRSDMLNDALDGELLSVRERFALALILIGNCSTHDVARLLDDSEENTVHQLSSAIRRLRRHLLDAEPSLP